MERGKYPFMKGYVTSIVIKLIESKILANNDLEGFLIKYGSNINHFRMIFLIFNVFSFLIVGT